MIPMKSVVRVKHYTKLRQSRQNSLFFVVAHYISEMKELPKTAGKKLGALPLLRDQLVGWEAESAPEEN